MYYPSKEVLEELRKHDIVVRSPKPDIKTAGGTFTDFYINVKKALGESCARILFAEKMHALILKTQPKTTCLAGSGVSAALATTISDFYELPIVYVRSEEKKHGLGGLLEGHIPAKNDVVARVDDLYTNGTTMRKMAEALRPTKATVEDCYVLVNRNPNPPENMHYIIEASDLLEIAKC
jgi:orotate phosphoribosyltransferase